MVYSLRKFIIINLMAFFVSSSESQHKLHEVGWLDRLHHTKHRVDEVFFDVVSAALSIILLESLNHVAHHLRVLAFLVNFSHNR